MKMESNLGGPGIGMSVASLSGTLFEAFVRVVIIAVGGDSSCIRNGGH